MTQHGKEKLTEKFWNNELNLDEEFDLLVEASNDNLYFSFLANAKEIPANLQGQVWDGIMSNRKTRKLKIRRMAVAASILVIIGVSVSLILRNKQQNQLAQQFALLEQTLGYVSEEIAPAQPSEVVYEDEFILVVAN